MPANFEILIAIIVPNGRGEEGIKEL